MANVIKPKHGETDPPQNALQYGEIGINDLTMFVGTDKGSKKLMLRKQKVRKQQKARLQRRQQKRH